MRGPFDSSTKAFYRALFGGWGLAVEAELEVFARGRTIDLAVQCGEEDFGRLGDTCFDHFRFLNAIEFKGPEDPLTVPDYNRVMMRAWGLGALGPREDEGDGSVVSGPDAPTHASRKPSYPFPWERTLTIVCVTRPDSILGNRGYGFRPTERPGVYHQGGPLPQWIIHPAEMEVTPRNYALLPLARGQTLASFVDVCLRQRRLGDLRLVLDIGLLTDPRVIWHKIREVGEMRAVLPEETWEDIDRFFREAPEAREKLPFLRETIEDSRREGEIRGETRQLKQVLLRMVQQRLSRVPPETARRVQETKDLAILNRWLDALLEDRLPADMGLESGHGEPPAS